jgi:carboxylesterase
LNRHEGRVKAGQDLARLIERDAAKRNIHLVGHSHGGNVALVAVNQLPSDTVQSVVVLANPNIVVLDSRGQPPEWLYWGHAAERVRQLWNLYSPQDFVQCGLVRLFHGVPKTRQGTLQVRASYSGIGAQAVQRGEIRWASRLAAHRAMHSAKMGAVVGSLLAGSSFEAAMSAAALSVKESNAVRDRGGWPGRSRTEEMIRALGNPQPFDLGDRASKTGLLFIHGFTASPAEMRQMAESLSSKTGWRCIGPLLPGHGTRVDDMEGTSAEDWVRSIDQAYAEIAGTCDHVFLVGLSLGALLAANVALRRSGDSKLRGMILMAPAFGVRAWRAIGMHLLRPVRKLRDKGKRASDYFLDHRLYTYLHIPLNRAAEVLRLGRQTIERIGTLKNLPTLMFIGERESTVSLDKMLSVAKQNPWIRLIRLPRSRHILPVEPDREMLFEATRRFVEECLGNSPHSQ